MKPGMEVQLRIFIPNERAITVLQFLGTGLCLVLLHFVLEPFFQPPRCSLLYRSRSGPIMSLLIAWAVAVALMKPITPLGSNYTWL